MKSAPTLQTGYGTKDIAVADFNNDHLSDFVVVNHESGNSLGEIIIFTQSAGANFQKEVPATLNFSPTAGQVNGSAVVVGNFNSDNLTDIIVVGNNTDGSGANTLVLTNLGNNNFSPAQLQIGTMEIYNAATSDLNGDGKLDLITTAYDGVSVSFGTGNATFSAPVKYLNGVSSNQIVVGDFNGDLKTDVAVVNEPSKLGIFLNTGNGTLTLASNTTFDNGINGLTTADITGDGKLDLIYNTFTGVAVSAGNGNGTFNAPVVYNLLRPSNTNLTVTDLNGDGRLDVADLTGGNTVTILLNSGSGLLSEPTVYSGGADETTIAAADLNNDQKNDLIVGYTASRNGYIKILFNQTIGEGNIRHRAFDFDGDGKSDLAVFRPSNGTWYVQQSQNGFLGAAFGLGTDKIVPADYDGDGKTDLAVYRNGTWYLQRSQLGFIGIQFGIANDIPVPADYDGDGKADLAVYRDGIWYLLQSTAGFTGVQFGVSNDKPVPADYDGDGKADIAVFRSGTWYLNRSTAGFASISFGLANDNPVENAFVR